MPVCYPLLYGLTMLLELMAFWLYVCVAAAEDEFHARCGVWCHPCSISSGSLLLLLEDLHPGVRDDIPCRVGRSVSDQHHHPCSERCKQDWVIFKTQVIGVDFGGQSGHLPLSNWETPMVLSVFATPFPQIFWAPNIFDKSTPVVTGRWHYPEKMSFWYFNCFDDFSLFHFNSLLSLI